MSRLGMRAASSFRGVAAEADRISSGLGVNVSGRRVARAAAPGCQCPQGGARRRPGRRGAGFPGGGDDRPDIETT